MTMPPTCPCCKAVRLEKPSELSVFLFAAQSLLVEESYFTLQNCEPCQRNEDAKQLFADAIKEAERIYEPHRIRLT